MQATAFFAEITRPGSTRLTGLSKLVVTSLNTGQTATLNSSGPSTTDSSGNAYTFGDAIWANSRLIPYEATKGPLSFSADGVLSTTNNNAEAIDPCALVGPAPDLTPATTPAPWGVPANALSRIGYAGLIANLGVFVRHDHVHLDMIINGQAVTVPAGIGTAEPYDLGHCPPGPAYSNGDCATGNFYEGVVADAPLHTHSVSGIIHIESDRPGQFTLGQFFDEWGVRLDQSCVGGYCTGDGKEMRVYVNGNRLAADPYHLVLSEHQEIAVIYGGPGAFNSVPSSYNDWPDPTLDCGGTQEPAC
jgi:hypothetical protein